MRLEWYLAWCWLGSVLVGPMLAEAKGRSLFSGFLYGLALGPFGLIVIGLMPDQEPRESDADRARRIRSELRGESPEKPAASRSLRTGADDDFDARAHFGGR